MISIVSGFVERVRGTDLHLDGLGRALADQEIVLALQVQHDGVVHRVARHAHRPRIDDSGERNDRDIRSAAADIDHHVAGGFRDRKTRADCRHHRLFDEMNFARFGTICRIHDRAFFHLRDLARDADYDPRVHEHLAIVRLVDEVIQHLLGDFEIGDDAVFHRLDGDDVAGSAAEHLLRFFADGFHFTGGFIEGYDGGLVDNNAFPFGVNESICGAEVDGEVRRKQAEKRAKIHLSDLKCKAGACEF